MLPIRAWSSGCADISYLMLEAIAITCAPIIFRTWESVVKLESQRLKAH